jgi:Orthopoxvirus protein of unknown function (DUF830).
VKKLLIVVILVGLLGCRSINFQSLQNGDIIFQISNSSQSLAIQAATHSKYTHLGLIFIENGQYYVLEAVQPVKFTPLRDWIKRGKDGHYVVKRLKNYDKVLNIDVLKKMKVLGRQYLRKNYDLYFEWSDDRMYCSELVWKIYKKVLGIEIGKLQRFKEFDLSNPIVKAKLKERYGNAIPLNELVISPDQMFRSDLLKTVIEK